MADQLRGATRLKTSITAGVPKVGDPFLLGVNYWPRRKAMYFWTQFDPGEVRDEFALIKDVGIRVVRFFLRWEDFQPEFDRIDPQQIRNLETVAQIASDVGVLLEPTLFCGHMSGPNWSPSWLLEDSAPAIPGWRPLIVGGRVVDRRIRNVYVDPFAIEAEERIVRAACGALSGHPAVWAWSLGNEPDLFCHPPTDEDGAAWTARMTNLIHEVDPAHPVTIGLHTVSLEHKVGLRVDQLAEGTDFSVMHGYSIYAGWAKEPLDSDVVPFANALTSALAGRPALFEEYGLCTAQPGVPSHYQTYPVQGRQMRQFFPSEEDGARYYEQVLPKLVKVGALGASGWCFADYVPELWDRPPCDTYIHERFFGFIRPDGSLKPIADVIRRFARSNPVVQAPAVEVKLDITPDEYYQDPGGHLRRLFQGFTIP